MTADRQAETLAAVEPEYFIVQPGLDGVAWLGEVDEHGEASPIGKVADILDAASRSFAPAATEVAQFSEQRWQAWLDTHDDGATREERLWDAVQIADRSRERAIAERDDALARLDAAPPADVAPAALTELQQAALCHAIECYSGPDDDTLPVLRALLPASEPGDATLKEKS